jgi:hypothetical protein
MEKGAGEIYFPFDETISEGEFVSQLVKEFLFGMVADSSANIGYNSYTLYK